MLYARDRLCCRPQLGHLVYGHWPLETKSWDCRCLAHVSLKLPRAAADATDRDWACHDAMTLWTFRFSIPFQHMSVTLNHSFLAT